MNIYLQGLTMGLAYVAPIGLQNLFVINSALTQKRSRVYLTALIVIFWDISLGVACFIAADVGIGFLSVRLIDNPSSILTTTGFYACRIVGTLIGAWVLVKVSDVKYLTWNMTGALALCAAVLFVRNEAAIYAAVGVLGFAMACVFATF